jgi:hypothetical protein
VLLVILPVCDPNPRVVEICTSTATEMAWPRSTPTCAGRWLLQAPVPRNLDSPTCAHPTVPFPLLRESDSLAWRAAHVVRGVTARYLDGTWNIPAEAEPASGVLLAARSAPHASPCFRNRDIFRTWLGRARRRRLARASTKSLLWETAQSDHHVEPFPISVVGVWSTHGSRAALLPDLLIRSGMSWVGR